MRKISMYWNNICVLHRYEKKHIEEVTSLLKEQDILLETEYFGLGYPKKLSEEVKKTGITPDIMVSTDLEVFEDPEIYGLFKEELLEIQGLLSLKNEIRNSNLCQDKRLLPFLVIPLIMVFNKQLLAGQPLPVSLKELAEHPKAFGGKTNSAGRGVYKQLTWLYGKEFTDLFMENATIFDMPVQSLQSVQKGLSPAAITPSIFAFRADETLLSLRYPKEGALTVPSFIAVKNTLSTDLAGWILSKLFTVDFCNYFAEYGEIQPCFQHTKDVNMVAEHQFRFVYPDFAKSPGRYV
ncbi:MAG: ABC transporter substrate-binding protein [Hungatella sp.]|nr:ABC transporter substrate-binding protein [Hungatella sp.]